MDAKALNVKFLIPFTQRSRQGRSFSEDRTSRDYNRWSKSLVQLDC